MGFNLKKMLEEKWADVNVFDGGKTGASVRANRPAPATTPPPGGGRLQVGNFNNNQRMTVGQNQPSQDIRIDQPKPFRPTAPVSVAPSTNQRLFVGDTEIKSDPTSRVATAPRIEAPKPPDRRGLASKVWDTVNIADSGRSYGNAEVRENKSVGQVSRDVGKSIVKAPAQMLNTAGAQIPQVALTVENQFATNEYSKATQDLLKAQKSGNRDWIVRAKLRASDAANRVSDVNAKVEAANSMFNQNEGGLFNAGTFYGEEDARRGDLKTGIQKIGGGTLATAATVVPMAKGGSFVLGNNPVTKAAVGRLVGEGMVYGAGYSVGDQYQNTGKIDPGRLAVDTVAGGVLNTAIPLAGRGMKNATPKLVDYAKTTAPKVAQKAGELGDEMFNNPRPAKLNDDQVGVISRYRENMGTPNLDDATYYDAREALETIGLPHTDTNAIDSLLGDFRTYGTRKLQSQAGFVDPGQMGKDIKKAFTGGAEDAPAPKKPLKVEQPTNPVDDLIVQDRKALAGIDHELAENKRINAEVDGNAKPTTLTDRQRNQIIKKAEDDFVAGRIPAVKMEAVQNDPARFVKDYMPSQAKKLEVAPLAPTKPLARALPEETTPTARNQAPAEEIPPTVSNTPESAQTSTVKLNTKRLDVPDEAAARLDAETTEVIKRLTNKEVQQAAKDAGIDIKSYGIDGTKKKIAEQLNMRNRVVTIERKLNEARKAGAGEEEVAALIRESAEAGRIARSQGTDVGRQLQARRIIADQLATPQQKVFRLLDEAGVDPEVYSRRFADVDMNNADEVAKGYRDLVPAGAEDWLDKFRYTNMLSSPLTHMVNITSNLGGIGGIAPVQKLVEGAVDATKSALTGKARTRFAGEAGSYVKGVAEAVPEALQTFKAVMSGKKPMEMPDIEHAVRNGKLAYGGAKGATDTLLSIIPRFLEASDQAGMTLTKSGEMASLMKRQAKGVIVEGDLTGKVEDAALYRVFRQELGKEGQGYVLDAFDWLPSKILEGRRSKNPVVRNVSKFTLPFVTTPTNLFKQGLEYSPAGIVTLAGNADKVSQVAKMTMGGATVGLAAGAFAANDAITFSEPTDKKQRDAFRAEGKQPYSVKIGNKWLSYSKTHPAIAFNFAAVAAVKDAQDKGNMTESEADQALRMFAGVTGFFRDQSYMKAVGDFSSNIQMKDGGDAKAAMASMGSNYANQLVPFKSLQSWIGRQIDPTQRKTDTTASAPNQIWQNMVKDIPGLNKNVPVRVDPYTGQPIVNELDRHNGILPSVNALNPFKASEDKGYGKTTGLNLEQRMVLQELPKDQQEEYRKSILDEKGLAKLETKEKDAIKNGELQELATGNKPSVKGDSFSKSDKTAGATTDVRQLKSGKYYAKVGGEYKTFDKQSEATEAVGKAKFEQSDQKYQTIGDRFYYKDKNGDVKSENVDERTTKITVAQSKLAMDSAKANNDFGTWRTSAEKQLGALQKKAEGLDPEINAAELAGLQLTAQNLVQEMQKYSSYGNSFDKPKKGRTGSRLKGSSSNGLDYDLFGFGTDPRKTSSALRELVKRAKVTR